LRFLHIPKTGGTTLLKRVLQLVSEHAQEGHSLVRCYSGISPEQCTVLAGEAAALGATPYAARYLVAHAAVTATDVLKSRNGSSSLIAILRHPLTRLISYYNFLQLPPDAVAFAQWFRAKQQAPLRNIMTAYLSGTASGPHGLVSAHPAGLTRGHLQRAKALLAEDVWLFGLQEDYQAFVKALPSVWPEAARLDVGWQQHFVPLLHRASSGGAPAAGAELPLRLAEDDLSQALREEVSTSPCAHTPSWAGTDRAGGLRVQVMLANALDMELVLYATALLRRLQDLHALPRSGS
jgi:hypothetical protein